jgi:putative oxidoreductase
MINATFVKNLTPQLLSLMRLIVAFLFIQHGGQKLFNYPVPMPGPPLELFSLIGLAGVLEFFGGLLLLVGLFTRWTAFILSGQMAVAYFMAHAGQGFWPLANHGELAVAYCFVFLYLAAAGGGPWSLDRLRGKA